MPAENLSATSMYLHIEGVNGGMIAGESKDAAHPNEIQLHSFEVRVTGSNTAATEGSWQSTFPPVTLTVVTGRASPFLFRAACAGTVFKRLTISCRKHGAGKTAGDYMQWRFNDVQVLDYVMKVEDDKPTETIQISYQIVEVYYARQDQDGSLKDPVKRSWSLDENKEAPLTLPFTPKGAAAS